MVSFLCFLVSCCVFGGGINLSFVLLASCSNICLAVVLIAPPKTWKLQSIHNRITSNDPKLASFEAPERFGCGSSRSFHLLWARVAVATLLLLLLAVVHVPVWLTSFTHLPRCLCCCHLTSTGEHERVGMGPRRFWSGVAWQICWMTQKPWKQCHLERDWICKRLPPVWRKTRVCSVWWLGQAETCNFAFWLHRAFMELQTFRTTALKLDEAATGKLIFTSCIYWEFTGFHYVHYVLMLQWVFAAYFHPKLQATTPRLSRYKAMKAAFEAHGFSELFEDPTKLDSFLATHRQVGWSAGRSALWKAVLFAPKILM